MTGLTIAQWIDLTQNNRTVVACQSICFVMRKIGLLSLSKLLVGITAGKLAGNKLWMDSKH